jgi:hypothetical protein
MVSFSNRENVGKLKQRVSQINPDLAEQLEVEELILYPHVTKRLQKHRLHHFSGYEPSKVTKEQI